MFVNYYNKDTIIKKILTILIIVGNLSCVSKDDPVQLCMSTDPGKEIPAKLSVELLQMMLSPSVGYEQEITIDPTKATKTLMEMAKVFKQFLQIRFIQPEKYRERSAVRMKDPYLCLDSRIISYLIRGILNFTHRITDFFVIMSIYSDPEQARGKIKIGPFHCWGKPIKYWNFYDKSSGKYDKVLNRLNPAISLTYSAPKQIFFCYLDFMDRYYPDGQVVLKEFLKEEYPRSPHIEMSKAMGVPMDFMATKETFFWLMSKVDMYPWCHLPSWYRQNFKDFLAEECPTWDPEQTAEILRVDLNTIFSMEKFREALAKLVFEFEEGSIDPTQSITAEALEQLGGVKKNPKQDDEETISVDSAKTAMPLKEITLKKYLESFTPLKQSTFLTLVAEKRLDKGGFFYTYRTRHELDELFKVVMLGTS